MELGKGQFKVKLGSQTAGLSADAPLPLKLSCYNDAQRAAAFQGKRARAVGCSGPGCRFHCAGRHLGYAIVIIVTTT